MKKENYGRKQVCNYFNNFNFNWGNLMVNFIVRWFESQMDRQTFWVGPVTNEPE